MTQLNPRQRAFLRFFLKGEADRRAWLDGAGRTIAPVTDPLDPPPGAVRVLVYRLADGEGVAFRGEALDRTSIALPDLWRLGLSCWAEPLCRLSDAGRQLAEQPPAYRVGRSVKLPEDLDKRLAAKAKAEGRTVTAILLDLINRNIEEG